MYISYKKSKDGTLYATVMESRRVDGKSVKTSVDYLGVVVDKEKGIYRSRDRGTFTYDLEENRYGVPDWGDVPRPKAAGTPRRCLDFGDSYLLDRVVHEFGMDRCIRALGTGGEDTIFALLGFCIFNERLGMCNAEEWFAGNFASILYPGADLRSQRISDALYLMGDEQSFRDFFAEYLPLVNGDGGFVAIDSKGIVNAIDVELTQTSNHNGQVSVELRLIMVVQLGTGMPVYYRIVAGNILDASTLVTTMDELKRSGVNTDFAVVDAGYCNIVNMDKLFEMRVNFVTRLNPNLKVYKQLISENGDNLEEEGELVVYNHRLVYIKRVECQLTERNRGYGYIILDSDRKYREEKKLTTRYEAGSISDSELREGLASAGRFVLVSSYMIALDDVLSVYYSRQSAEQFFDLANGYASLTPLRVHSEETIRGMIMLTFMSASMVRYIQRKLTGTAVPVKAAFLSLRNQKCRIYDDCIVVEESMKKANDAYKACGIEPPKEVELPMHR